MEGKGREAVLNAFCVFQVFLSVLSKWWDSELLSTERIHLDFSPGLYIHIYNQSQSSGSTQA